MWLLGFELKTFGRAVSALTHWAISSIPLIYHFNLYYLIKIFNFCNRITCYQASTQLTPYLRMTLHFWTSTSRVLSLLACDPQAIVFGAGHGTQGFLESRTTELHPKPIKSCTKLTFSREDITSACGEFGILKFCLVETSFLLFSRDTPPEHVGKRDWVYFLVFLMKQIFKNFQNYQRIPK